MTLAIVESPGKRLRDRRLEKQMSIADVARVTHIRQDRILDLEKDDYSNFPSLSYARGFLLIYARLLGVDVSEAAVRLENSNPVDIEEYEYLSGKPAPLTRSLGVGRRIAVVLGIILCIFLTLGLVVKHFINYANAINDSSQVQKDTPPAHVAPQATPVVEATPVPTATPAPVVVQATPIPVAIAVPGGDYEVVLHPLKKAWVKVEKDSDGSPPIYEDWLYPDADGLTLHGKKFWIQLSDGDAVEIKKNGQVIPYNSPGIVIQ